MVVYFSFLLLSVIWLGILISGPFLLAHNYHDKTVIDIYYSIFKLICHQKPERSYFLWGYQMPVCARCLGIYLGMLIGTVIYPFFKNPKSTRMPNITYLLIFLCPIIFDGTAQLFELYPSPNYIRLLTGIWASGGLVFWALPLFNSMFNKYLKNNN